MILTWNAAKAQLGDSAEPPEILVNVVDDF
jgi:hypothetical protein